MAKTSNREISLNETILTSHREIMYKNNKCTKICGLSLGICSFIYGWLSLLLRPLGYRVFRRVIRLSSCVSIIEEIFSFGAFSIFPMMVNLAFAEKS